MRQSIIIISLFLMAILTLLAGWRISEQDKTIAYLEETVNELVKRQIVNEKNDKFLYDKMIEHEASIRLIKNGAFK